MAEPTTTAAVTLCALPAARQAWPEAAPQPHPCPAVGDKTLAQCLWKAGVAHTDPGWQARHPERFLFDMWNGNVSSLEALVGAAARGACDSACREDLEHVVSLHLSARQYDSMGAAADAALAVTALYDSYFNATPGRVTDLMN